MNALEARAYKQAIADLYSQRSATYDQSEWHDRIAQLLVEYAHLRSGDRVLDIATGTGMVAFYAAEKIGPTGSVLGIDIAEGMLAQARQKYAQQGLTNLQFMQADGEHCSAPEESFDAIFCGSAFIWMTDLYRSLCHWRRLLKPQGVLGFHAFSEHAFVTGVVAQSVLKQYGVDYQMSQATGTVEKCRALMVTAGFSNIQVIEKSEGQYITGEAARRSWVSAAHPAPGQYPHPLTALTAEQLAQAQAEYERAIDQRTTVDGVWDDMTTFYVYGRKQP